MRERYPKRLLNGATAAPSRLLSFAKPLPALPEAVVARWLLATTALTVTEFCMAVGFSSLGSFSRLFRLRCGESPLNFRKRLQRFDEPARRSRLAPHCLPLMAAAWSEPPYFSRSDPPAR